MASRPEDGRIVSGLFLNPVLLHYPVEDRDGNEITAAVTNLDLHDLARIAITYQTGDVWVVTPVVEQQQLVKKIIEHWTSGIGARRNPDRKLAFAKLRLAGSLAEVAEKVHADADLPVFTVSTSARKTGGEMSFGDLHGRLNQSRERCLLLFGTAWGISRKLQQQVDCRLEPVQAGAGYNHLPVRAAAAITIDRLLGR